MRFQNVLIILGFAAHVQSQFIIGALALFEIAVEIIDVAGAVVAEVSTTVDLGITAEAIEGALEFTAEETESTGAAIYAHRTEEVAHSVHGTLSLGRAKPVGRTNINGNFRLDIDPIILDSRTITPEVTAEFNWHGVVQGTTRSGIAPGHGAPGSFTIQNAGIVRPRVTSGSSSSGFSARIKRATTKMLKASS